MTRGSGYWKFFDSGNVAPRGKSRRQVVYETPDLIDEK